jgi:hypothetical protein
MALTHADAARRTRASLAKPWHPFHWSDHVHWSDHADPLEVQQLVPLHGDFDRLGSAQHWEVLWGMYSTTPPEPVKISVQHH